MLTGRRLHVCGLFAAIHLGGATALPASPRTGTFLDRPAADLRVVTYNVLWDSIFSRVNPTRAAGFTRLAAAIAPDVWAFQELSGAGQPSSTAAELKALLDTVQPTPLGWHVFKSGGLALASRWPLTTTTATIAPAGDRPVMAAAVDLPDADHPVDLYLINAHYRCCSGTTNDPFRQRDSDAIVSWMRDARTPGGSVALPYATPMIVLGDLNIVGGQQPLSTLVTGDIQDGTRYGPDSPPDWDGGPNVILAAPHNAVAGAETYTWRNDRSIFGPSQLDFMIYTDSVLAPTRGFVVNTASMTPTDLAAAGLQPFDALYDGGQGNYDHLPVVMDFRIRAAPSLAIRIDVGAAAMTQAAAGYGPIRLAPSLTKTGSGTLVLDAANTFTGPTTIAAGALSLASQSALGRSGRIDVAAGASFDVTAIPAGYALAAGQTLAGSGTVRGSVVFGAGATLAPGDWPATALTASMLSADDPSIAPTVHAVPEPRALALPAAACGAILLGAIRRRTTRRASRSGIRGNSSWQREPRR